jgi:hypothetical protein
MHSVELAQEQLPLLPLLLTGETANLHHSVLHAPQLDYVP